MNLLKLLNGSSELPIIDLNLTTVNKSGKYNLPTSAFEFQKELTDQIVSLHYSDILKYCETNTNTELIRKSLEICINNCILVSNHPYLLISHYIPKNLALRDMLNKLAQTSGKFQVLRDFLNLIIELPSKKDKHVGVVINNNMKFFDLVESLLLYCSGPKQVKRYVGNCVKKESSKPVKNSEPKSSITYIYLLPSNGENMKEDENLGTVKFDMLIAFDCFVDTKGEFFKKIASQNRKNDLLVVRLVPVRSIEHCKLHHENTEQNPGYLYNLISSIVCLRDQIGILSPDVVPIFNQRLKYMSDKFLNAAFSNSGQYPAWPLPELPKISRFSPQDVERSLLTDIQFHYSSSDEDEPLPRVPKRKPSYYETKRLELDYATNSLKTDFNELRGFTKNASLNEKAEEINNEKKLLTHMLIFHLVSKYHELDVLDQEFDSYVEFNSSHVQSLVGRREKEVKGILSNIIDDVDHAESRIQLAEKRISKKEKEIEILKEDIKKNEFELGNFLTNNKIENSNHEEFYRNTRQLWQLQEEVRSNINRINTRQEEKNYMQNECQNALLSIGEIEGNLEQAKEENSSLKRQLEGSSQTEENEKTKRSRDNLIGLIEKEHELNNHYKDKLGGSFKFLRDTNHLKKRKSRGITPSK